MFLFNLLFDYEVEGGECVSRMEPKVLIAPYVLHHA